MTEGPWAAAQGALLDHRHHGGGTSREDGLWPLDPGADCFGKGNILQTRLLTPPLPCVLDIHHTECKIGHLPHQTVWWVSYFTQGVVDVLCGGCHTIPPIILHICNFLYATDFFGLEKVRKKMVSIQDKHFFATKQLKLIFIQIHIGILVGVFGVLGGIHGVLVGIIWYFHHTQKCADLCLYSLNTCGWKQSLSRSLWKKYDGLKKYTTAGSE